MGEIHVNLCFTLFWKKWDEFREYQNANRDRREIDLLMAQARDDLESDSDEDYEIWELVELNSPLTVSNQFLFVQRKLTNQS